MKFCFIILHYGEKALIDTRKCVESILENLSNEEYKIIIIDNGSKDSSADYLTELYYENKFIDVVLNEENIGFARGNNIGCDYAVTKYNPEYLIVINNDTIILQNDFLEMIHSEYLTNPFDILGPNIINKYGLSQSPLRQVIKGNIEEIDNEISDTKKQIKSLEGKFNFFKVKRLIIEYFKGYDFIYNLYKKKYETKKIKTYDNNTNVPLHGAAIVFSKGYIKKFRNAIFYPGTFLFLEEDILFYIANKEKLIMRYQPKLMIYHTEDASTDGTIGSRNKHLFLLENRLNSLKAFKKLVLENMDTKLVK